MSRRVRGCNGGSQPPRPRPKSHGLPIPFRGCRASSFELPGHNLSMRWWLSSSERLRRWLGCALVATVPVSAGTMASTAKASAPTSNRVSLGRVPRSVPGGARLSLKVSFAPGTFSFADTNQCVATISRGQGTDFAEASPNNYVQGGTLTVLIPRRAHVGRTTIRVSCPGATSVSTTFAVRRRRDSRSRYGDEPLSLRFRPTTRPYTLVELNGQAQVMWAQKGAGILAGWRGTGQCTDWASQKRPDVIERVVEADYVASVRHQPTEALGDAHTWASVAAWAGMTVSDMPMAGALVVWQPGVEGANPGTGHVGYVESVSSDGSTFSTSEMNVGGVGQMGYRTLSTTPISGRLFIWR